MFGNKQKASQRKMRILINLKFYMILIGIDFLKECVAMLAQILAFRALEDVEDVVDACVGRIAFVFVAQENIQQRDAIA